MGLRANHYETILTEKPAIDWFEIITENYFTFSGKPLYYLEKIRESYPVVMHGVSMSIGSTDPLNWDYLHQVKRLANHIQPCFVSDHLCWTGIQGKNTHDLLPLPYTEEAIQHVVDRIQQVQDFLGRQILIENVSSYVTYQQSAMTEWEFVHEILRQSDCFLLLDVNNVYVSSVNHQFDPFHYIKSLPSDRIYQIHLAGHTHHGDYIIDTHDSQIVDAVWDLYAKTLQHHGQISTMIERDDKIPPLSELLAELNYARILLGACAQPLHCLLSEE